MDILTIGFMIWVFIGGATLQEVTHILPEKKATTTQAVQATQAQAALKELAKNACEKGDHEACEYVNQVH